MKRATCGIAMKTHSRLLQFHQPILRIKVFDIHLRALPQQLLSWLYRRSGLPYGTARLIFSFRRGETRLDFRVKYLSGFDYAERRIMLHCLPTATCLEIDERHALL